MTPQRAKELLPIITAFAEGKTVQFRISPHNPWSNNPAPSWANFAEYRIAPEPAPPRKVPLGPDDFPPGSAVRLADEVAREPKWEIVTAVRATSIDTDLRELTYEELADEYKVFTPGKGWGPGFKLEE